jgi:SAM-dependent methyltransferase
MESHQHSHRHPGHPGHSGHSAAETDAAMAELLDLDAEVMHSYLAEATAWIRPLAAEPPPRRILDLGSGTGTGAFALLERFDQAEVIALDVSAEMLHRLSSKARVLGVADRIRTVQADLDEAWPGIDAVDLVWASSSLHHMADPDRVLAGIFATLRPGRLLVVAEMASFPRFLPDDVGFGRPGLEARCQAVLDEQRTAALPHLGSDWGPRLSRAGFTIDAERPFVIDLAAPLPAATGRYAQATLRRIRSGLDGRMSPDDLAALDTLIDSDGPDGALHRGDLTVRTARTVWAARRP